MPDSSNIDEVTSWLDDFARSIRFDRPGAEGSLGADVAWAIIRGPDSGAQGGIMGRCAQEVAPDGTPWPRNSDEPAGKGYASKKMKKYGWDETNRRTNQMLSAASLYGKTTIEPEVVTLRYGTDQPPGQSYAPTGHLGDDDAKVTDTQKATWAHQQGRAFYGLGQGDPEAVHAVCQEAVGEMIREANGG